MLTESFSRSLWSALAPAPLPYTALAGEHDVDVLVIGGGFLGLSTALHLARAGTSVMVLEAEEAGFGASGRNTGFVVPSLRTSLGPEDVTALIGDAGHRLTALVADSGNIVFDTIKANDIDCSPERTGWLQPAHTPAVLRALEQRQKDLAGMGRHVDILSAAETRARIGGGQYPGALFHPTGGQINPLAYARGLARAATSAGATIHVASRVLGIDDTGPRPVARTANGRVTANRILLATNALVNGLMPPVARSIIPVRLFQIATQRFAGEAIASMLPQRTPVADTRRHTFAVRWSPDNRLITGGLVLPGPGRSARAEGVFQRRLKRLFPGHAPFKAEYVWSGVVAATLDSMPRFMRVSPHIDAAIGCNGRGVALTTALGIQIAALYNGQLEERDFALPIAPPQEIVGHAIARHGPTFWLPWSDLRDEIESRKG